MLSDDQETVSAESSIYGSFSLGHSEFALSVRSIKEVVNEPDGYSSVPLAPSYLLGLFNLRGIIVPVVDLREIFDLPVHEIDISEPRKIAIIEYGDLCLGLLFDATAEVFNGDDVESCWFESRGNSEKDLIVQGVFKLGEERRIVQILDAHGMLNLDKIPHTANSALSNQAKKRQGLRKQCISFAVGDCQCALDISSIKEIVNIHKVENTVLASDICLGAIDIRGNTVPIVNFSMLLGYQCMAVDGITYNDSSRVIVMKVGEELFGLLVDSIENIISYFAEDLIPFPVLGENKRNMFAGCISSTIDSRHTIVLKHDEIFTNEEVISITKGHSHLFKDGMEESRERKQGALDRKRLITFSLDNRYGLDISEVREVIDFPDDLIKTPTMSSYMRGMTNLRGELIAVIDSRGLYEMDELANSDDTKILVFERDGVKQGLMVDSVDSIMPFSPDDLIGIPKVMFNGAGNLIGEDVKQALLVKNETETETVCILDLSSVSARVSR